MRLVCPNCSAQYEIDGSMIPDDGRDVQCSNCGHTWFELPAPLADIANSANSPNIDTAEDDRAFSAGDYDDADAEDFEDDLEDESVEQQSARPDNLSREVFEDESDESAFAAPEPEAEPEFDDPEPEPEPEPAEPEPDPVAEPEDQAEPAPDTWSDPDDTEEEEEEPEAAPVAATGQRRPADAAALDILREEAERELSQRRAPPSESLETQTDLGLEAIRDRRTPSRALRARMAHLGEDLPEEEADAPKASAKSRLISPSEADEAVAYEEPRRDLLPDIEEINSTLKTAPATYGRADAKARSGFRLGFLIVVFAVGAAIFSYAQAPAIARALPDTESAMISYVDRINAFRDWVDGLIGGDAG